MTVLAVALGAIGPLAGTAQAQGQSGPPPGWSFSVTPYGWVPSISGTVSTPLPRVGDSSFDIGSGTVLSSLSTVPVMVAGEARYGRFALVGDIFYAGLQQDLNTRDVLFDGGHTRVLSTIANLLGMVRVVETPSQGFEVGAGVRIWSMSTKLSLNPGLEPGAIQKSSASWADPVVAARYTAMLSPRFGVTVYGDIGGFGAGSQLTWQALGSLDYSVTDRMILRGGWRYLYVEKSRGSFGVDIGFSGPFLAATFRF
jgi:opacity protein-like surface antigen